MKDYPFFKATELQCKCRFKGCKRHGMDDEFMELVNRLREIELRPLIVTSGYRCPAYNQICSTTGPDGPHTTGKAIDIADAGETAFQLVQSALDLGFTGIGVQQKGPWQGRFIHLDILEGPSRPRIWSY